MYRHIKFMTRPMILASETDRHAAKIPDRFEHPPFRDLPPATHFPVIFAHPNYTEQMMRCLVYWEERGISWWMDVPFARHRRLPHQIVAPDAYRW
jgi:hypothetical protein